MNLSSSDVADFFKANPDFLLQNPGILAFIHLPSPVKGNITSLQEKQLQSLKNKVKLLEHELVTLTRNAVENQVIIDNLFALQKQLLQTYHRFELPKVLVQQMGQIFDIPMVRLRLLGCSRSEQPSTGFEGSLSDAALSQLAQIDLAFCGFYDGSPITDMFIQDEIKPRSMVIIPLRDEANKKLFGCLAFGSTDKDRFTPNLGREFIYSLSVIACACLT